MTPERLLAFLLLLNGELVETRGLDPAEPIPAGSLVKPFAALAYAESHSRHYPELSCNGEENGCWRPTGHGRIGMDRAIAHSCNAYFRQLTARISYTSTANLASRFGIEAPPPGASLFGLGDAWRVSPLRLARAYLELARRVHEPGVSDLVRGLALSAREGTGKAVGPGALVKTGTGPCLHPKRAPGDGFVIALFPEENPVNALLVRVHVVPGAQAAADAARILRTVRQSYR